MNLSRVAIRQPVFTTMLMAALVVLGLFSFRRLSIDEYPDVSIPIVSIQTVYAGASPEAVEREVTRPIEEAINTIEGIDQVTSTSQEGVSVVVAEFALDVDENIAAEDVRARLDKIRRTLPADIEPPVIEKFDPSAKPIVSLGLFSERMPVRELTGYADEVLKPRLEAAPGVASVEIVGGLQRVIRVQLQPARMEALGVSIEQVTAALRTQNTEIPAGRLERGNAEQIVRVRGRLAESADFGDIIVAVRGGTPIHLREIATIEDASEEERSIARVDGQRAVALDVRKTPGSNTVAVAEAVKAMVAELAGELPEGVTLQVVQDNSTFIKNAVQDVQIALVLGAILTVLVVFLFLGDGRATTITALALPVSVISAFIIMDALDFTLNNMTLMGLSLAIGILVDDAIVVIENIVRHRRMGKSALEAAEDATRQLFLAVTATTATILAVFVPVAFMGGIVGKFFYQFALTVAWAISVSTLVSLTLTPMLAAWWAGPDEGEGEPREPTSSRRGGRIGRVLERMNAGFDRLGVAYRSAIGWALDRRKTTLGIAGVSLLGAVLLFPVIGGEFMSQSDRSQFYVHFETPAGSSLAYTVSKAEEIEQRVQGLPGVDYTYTTIGAGSGGSVEKGEVLVRLAAKRQRKLNQFEMIEAVRGDLAPLHGVSVSVLQAGKMGLVEKPVQVDIRGRDVTVLDRLARAVAEEIRRIPGAIEIESSLSAGKPEVRIDVRRALAAELGLSVGQIASVVRPAIAGDAVTTWEAPNGETYDVRLQLPSDQRTNPEDLARLPITTGRPDPATGGWTVVPLAQVAQIEPGTGPSGIERKQLERVVTVSASVARGANLKQVSDEIRARTAALDLPAGYTVSLGGETQDFEETRGYVLEALVLSVLLIYMILASQFGSFVHPLSIMVSLPLSLVGALLALLLFGNTMNIMSMIGVILLMGLVTKSAILLVEFTNELRADGMVRREALITAGQTRLRPVVMSALSTIFGMLPVALALGAGAEFRAPMARAVIGGLTTATLLTLIVIPVVYTYFDDLALWARARLARRREARRPAVAREAGQVGQAGPGGVGLPAPVPVE
jgi:hydrophobic/amphiphilic exporter-1 (mainly G- bacteria), HAE1 family